MKTITLASAFVLGVLLVGVGNATAVSMNLGEAVERNIMEYPAGRVQTADKVCCEKFGSGAMMNKVNQSYFWTTAKECSSPARLVGGGNQVVADKYCEEKNPEIISRCANFPEPSFCEGDISRVVNSGAIDEQGCVIWRCQEKKINSNNEIVELEKKLGEVYDRIRQLNQEAEKLQKLLEEKRGNKTMPPQKACSSEYAPVCAQQRVISGCARGGAADDVNSRCLEERRIEPRTFPNKCEATLNNADVLYDGACNMGTKETRTQPVFPERKKEIIINPSLNNTRPAVREILPLERPVEQVGVVCTMESSPVCAQTASSSCPKGSDCIAEPRLKTYSNKCVAASYNATVVYEGACKLEGENEMTKDVQFLNGNDGPRQRIESSLLDASTVDAKPVSKKVTASPSVKKWETILRYFGR